MAVCHHYFPLTFEFFEESRVEFCWGDGVADSLLPFHGGSEHNPCKRPWLIWGAFCRLQLQHCEIIGFLIPMLGFPQACFTWISLKIAFLIPLVSPHFPYENCHLGVYHCRLFPLQVKYHQMPLCRALVWNLIAVRCRPKDRVSAAAHSAGRTLGVPKWAMGFFGSQARGWQETHENWAYPNVCCSIGKMMIVPILRRSFLKMRMFLLKMVEFPMPSLPEGVELFFQSGTRAQYMF